MIRSQSIKRKQMLLLMLTSGVALLLACSAFLAYERLSFRAGLTHKLESLATILGRASAAAVEFRDTKAAEEILATLADEQNITAAVIYDREGQPFAQYVRREPAGALPGFTPPAPLADGHDFSATHLSVFRRITSKAERAGTIYLQSDLRELSGRLHQYVQIVLIVLLASALVALLLSVRLQRVIIDPVLALAGTAKKVSAEKNYGLRVKVQTRDELGELMTIFNQMLEHIQERDAALQRAHDDLDTRVRERTSELQQQILDRTKAEKDLQQQLTRISLLNSITRAIAARQDLESVVKVVLRHLEEQLPIDFGEVQLYDKPTRSISPARHGTAYFKREGAFTSNTPLEGSGLEPCGAGNTVVAADPCKAEGALKARMETLGLKSLIGVPLMVEGELFGILITARKAAGFSSGECEFLRMLSEQVALAAHQARLHAQLQRAYDELRQTQIAIMQEERLRALGQMASGIAHDINNALCPVVVYADLMLSSEKNLSESGLKNLQNIKTSGEDIAHIVSRMREFYRRRDDRDAHLPVNLNRIATQVIELTRPRWRDIPQARGIMIELRTEFEDGLPHVAASESELREAITNLLLNAIDAMPNGGEIVLRTVTRGWIADADGQRKPSHVALEVRDSGIGMTEEIRKRCLEPFFSTKGKRGTGLGLAMVYGVMERHEGSIEIESEPGKGTRMRLVFPMRETAAISNGSGKPTHAPLPTLRILCIDDEPLLREMLEQLLENSGHVAALADCGQAGLEMFRNARQLGDPFDVVVTDLGMPRLDGRQVAQTIKRESPDTPVIMLTGWGTMMKDDGDTPTQVDAVLSKPPKINELFETISKVLEIRRTPKPPLDKAA